MFISCHSSIIVEKRRFSVFTLSWNNTRKKSIAVRQREANTLSLWIVHSDSEYGLLLQMKITDSYPLNATTNESIDSQKSWNCWGHLMQKNYARFAGLRNVCYLSPIHNPLIIIEKKRRNLAKC